MDGIWEACKESLEAFLASFLASFSFFLTFEGVHTHCFAVSPGLIGNLTCPVLLHFRQFLAYMEASCAFDDTTGGYLIGGGCI